MDNAASPRGGSLQPSLVAESPPLQALTSKTGDLDMLASSALAAQYDRSKYTSPPPPTRSSITPPPSSQVPVKHVLRTPSPPTSHLTSPPPTNRLPSHQPSTGTELPTADQINDASMDELRSMVESLSFALRESRASAAHFKLQHSMLLIDSSETTKRMEVELQLAQREIEVLQEAEERRRLDYVSPAQQAGTSALIEDLRRQSVLVQRDNEQLREMLMETTQTLEASDDALTNLRDENSRLRHRIRTNREHMNGILDSVSDGSPRSLLGTPRRNQYGTPRHAPTSRPIVSTGREPGAFDALLLADKVLNSQDTATAPSTPKTSPLKHRLGHTRNTHSLSSLPTTPPIRKPFLASGTSALRTPPHLTTINEPRSVGQPLPPAFAPLGLGTRRRRASSDSTITASSVDGDEQKHPHSEDEDTVPESQASQRAADMLRKTTGSSQQSSRAGTLSQSRITGMVTRPGMAGDDRDKEKRRLTSYGHDQGSPSKRGRVGGVGLGIGLLEHR